MFFFFLFNFSEHRECRPDQFRCGLQCIRQELVCDGHPDCPDREDEKNCTRCDVSSGKHFLCDNQVCIDYNLTCNGRNDCGDASDEPENCSK